jgi:hypothetical protein
VPDGEGTAGSVYGLDAILGHDAPTPRGRWGRLTGLGREVLMQRIGYAVALSVTVVAVWFGSAGGLRTSTIRVWLDTSRVPEHNEIDAVGLLSEAAIHWAVAADASSSYK